MNIESERKLPTDFENYAQYICDTREIDKNNHKVLGGVEGFFITSSPPQIGKRIPIADRWYIIRDVRMEHYRLPLPPISIPGEPEDDDPWYMQDEDDYAQHCEIDVTKLSGEANL
mgnify:FL=1